MSLFQRLWRLVLTWFGWNPEVTRPRLADVMKEEERKITDNEDEALTIYKVPFREELNLPEEMIVRKVLGEPGQF